MCTEVQSYSLASKVCKALDSASCSNHLCCRQDFGQFLRLPRKMLSLGILRDCRTSICGDGFPLSIKNDHRWNSLDLEFLGERSLSILVGERQCQPRLFPIVFIEYSFVAIRRDKNYFQTLRLQGVLVPLGKLWRESTAWRTPMGTEVESD